MLSYRPQSHTTTPLIDSIEIPEKQVDWVEVNKAKIVRKYRLTDLIAGAV